MTTTPQLYVYEPCRAADLLLAQLWARMDADGDLDKIFSDATFPLSHFLKLMHPPNEALYAADDDGIFILVWFERFAAGVFLSAYFRPDRRGGGDAHTLFRRILKSGIDAYGTIINMTWQEYLTPIHLVMGYTFVGRIPMLFHGRDALVFSCNRVSFDLAEERARTAALPTTTQERSWRSMQQMEEH